MPTTFPLSPSGTPLPQFNRVTASGSGTLDGNSAAGMLAANPRADALAIATIGGSATASDIVTLLVSCPTIPTGSLAFPYPVAAGDTTTTIAEGLCNAVNNSQLADQYGVCATLGGTGLANSVIVHWNGPVGNFATVSAAVTGAGTEIVTLGSGTTPVTNATETATVGGTVTTGNVLNLTFTNTAVTGLPVTVAATAAAGDTTTTLATKLAAAVNANATLQAARITATSAAAVVTLAEPGSVGNTTVVTSSVNGGTETITLSGAGGAMTGGAGVAANAAGKAALTGGNGPIIAGANFNYRYETTMSDFRYGLVYPNIGYDMLTRMVNQGVPII